MGTIHCNRRISPHLIVEDCWRWPPWEFPKMVPRVTRWDMGWLVQPQKGSNKDWNNVTWRGLNGPYLCWMINWFDLLYICSLSVIIINYQHNYHPTSHPSFLIWMISFVHSQRVFRWMACGMWRYVEICGGQASGIGRLGISILSVKKKNIHLCIGTPNKEIYHDLPLVFPFNYWQKEH